MKKNKYSKALVIDASVARSCGGEDATYPTAKYCRDFLNAVLTICYSMVLTDEIKTEWDKHQSTYARKWRATMIAKRKIKYRNNITLKGLRQKVEQLQITEQNSSQSEDIQQTESHKLREAIWKDICLLEAAIATDKMIMSLDDKMRNYLLKVIEELPEIKGIIWINPSNEKEQAIQWLEDGANWDDKRQLY